MTSSIESNPTYLDIISEEEEHYANGLVDVILDHDRREEIEERCKAIGQAIFEKAKKKTRGNSMAALASLRRIYTSVGLKLNIRKEIIQRAWKGVGDQNCQWDMQP
ncbi:MAG: hypothetical protein WAM28_07755 [Chlamydiales bacterium]